MPSIQSRYGLGTVVVYTAGEAIAKGQYLTLSAPNVVTVARADDPSLRVVVGVAFKAAAQGAKISVLTEGELRGLADLQLDVPYFLQPSGFAGLEPPRPGRAIRVGFAKSASTFHVRISDATQLVS